MFMFRDLHGDDVAVPAGAQVELGDPRASDGPTANTLVVYTFDGLCRHRASSEPRGALAARLAAVPPCR